MSDPQIAARLAPYKPKHKVRFVTAAALFDGHDAAINIMRRILQATGVEVIHLGHNRSVQEVVNAALQEDVQGIAVTSYQGGHIEYFKYMLDLLRQNGAAQIKVFGGGGGVIVPAEIAELHAYGVARIYSPEDGAKMGLAGHDQRGGDEKRFRAAGRCHARGTDERRSPQAGARDHVARERPAGRIGRGGARCAGASHARARHHRHRRRRQVEPHRRADPALPPRSGRQPAHRDHFHRPVAQAHRRRAVGRPHPHERDRPSEHLHALDGDAGYRQ
jgi:methylmalonyl-CoA mutase cobalamin-binding domain/chain